MLAFPAPLHPAALTRHAGLMAAHGLHLTETQALALCAHQRQTLSDLGRVEFGDGALPRLIAAFCPSPYVQRETWVSTLATLCDLFYAAKEASRETIPDDELAAQMAALYNGRAHGSLTLLADWVDALAHGNPQEDSPKEEDDDD